MKLRRKRYDPDEPVIGIRRAMIENGAIDAELDVEPEIIANLYAALGQMLGNAPNYLEASIEVKPAAKAPHEAFTVTIQRANGLTPHAARVDAEEQQDRLRELLLAWEDAYRADDIVAMRTLAAQTRTVRDEAAAAASNTDTANAGMAR